jgi:subtilisin family serine protease
MKFALKLMVAVLMTAPAFGNPLPSAASGTQRWIVTFKPTVKEAGRQQALSALHVTAKTMITSEGNTDSGFSAAVVVLPAGQSLSKPKAAQLAGSPLANIASIEPDQRVKWIRQADVSFQATPFNAAAFAGLKFPAGGQMAANPLKFGAAFARPEIPWGVNRVHAPAAWDVTQGQGVKVAVIDTGIDLHQQDLYGQVDGGYSAIMQDEKPADYQDDNGHGTHVSGIIAARQDGEGVVGVAPKARLYAVKVLGADGSGNLSDVIDGIIWATNHGMQVANMSLGAPIDSPAMHEAIQYAAGMGMVVVAAAGNSGGAVGYPGAYPEVITVAASDSQDRVAPFSSRGPAVDFIAPGVDIVSDRLGGGVVSYSGTSMATPHVTGLAALSLSQGWSGLGGPDGVMAQLVRAATPLPGLTTDEQGNGMIDAYKLVH